MTIKFIRWFEASTGVPAALHNPYPPEENPTSGSVVVCLNYKDYDDRAAGIEPWFLTHEMAVITLINEWGLDSWWDRLRTGAQEMVDYAASNTDHGFRDGDFYGIYSIYREEGQARAQVSVGLAYANSEFLLTPIRELGEKALPDVDTTNHIWVTPQFAIPIQVEVQMPGEKPVAIPRVSRYKRTPVI